jgi:molybdopterin-guanine dinucleotide biosynthesis protein A
LNSPAGSVAPIRVGGIVLCGGKSVRMGRPKLSLPFGDESMLGRIVRIVSQVVSPVVVVAAVEQELPTLPDGTLVTRDEMPDTGPLGGLASGIAVLRDQVDAVYLSSCDVPLVRTEFIRAIVASLGTYELAMPRDGQYLHPLAGVYRIGVESRARRLLAENRLKAQFLAQDSHACLIDTRDLLRIDPNLESLKNVNSADDYQAALVAANLKSNLGVS